MDEEIQKELEQLKQMGAIPYALKLMKIMKEQWQIMEQQNQQMVYQMQMKCEVMITDLLPHQQETLRAQLAESLEQGQKAFKSKMTQHKLHWLSEVENRLNILKKLNCQKEGTLTQAAKKEAAPKVKPTAAPTEAKAAKVTFVHRDNHVSGDHEGHNDKTETQNGKVPAQVRDDLRGGDYASGVHPQRGTEKAASQRTLPAQSVQGDQASNLEDQPKVIVTTKNNFACSRHPRRFMPMPMQMPKLLYPPLLESSRGRGRKRWRIRFVQPEKPVLKSWKKRKKHGSNNHSDQSNGVLQHRLAQLVALGSIQIVLVSSLAPGIASERGGEMMRSEE